MENQIQGYPVQALCHLGKARLDSTKPPKIYYKMSEYEDSEKDHGNLTKSALRALSTKAEIRFTLEEFRPLDLQAFILKVSLKAISTLTKQLHK